MSLDLAIRMTEIMLGFAFILQSIEHIYVGTKNDRILFSGRLGLSILLLAGLYTPYVCAGLVIITLVQLHRFQGPYNGGSDRMGILVLCALTLTYFLPSGRLQDMAFGYLAMQLILSYFISGWVKMVNPEWRNGQALQDVFAFSVYPVSDAVRGWSQCPRVMLIMSWAVIIFELAFPFLFLTTVTLYIGLAIAAAFHLANACLFGLNRFFWVWLAAYPSLIWLHDRLLGGV